MVTPEGKLEVFMSDVMQFGRSYGPSVGQSMMDAICVITREEFDRRDRPVIQAALRTEAHQRTRQRGLAGPLCMWMRRREIIARKIVDEEEKRREASGYFETENALAMGGGQGKAAEGGGGALEACDHTPIFACYDGLPEEEAIKAKEQVAASFVRVVVPDGKSIFESKVGRRDMLIVEKGELRMVSCHGEKNKKDRPLINMVAQGEMIGMMELVRDVESERDESTGEFPTDVCAVGKAALLVLSQEVYLKNLLTNTGDKAAKLFCDNFEALTCASVVDWLRKVKVLSGLDDECMNKFANIAHFKSRFADKLVVAQDAKLTKLHVALLGALRVHCHDSRGNEITVGHLQSGDFFGESSLLNNDDKDHGFLPLGSTASVTTESECLFIYFDADKMREVIETMPP
ncbi:hypothetical protein JL720_8534 [Aureococcus anophagefferens]|nr:hypothetical protein JL720_8534 [Aureococcus anophagefferens]